MSRRPTVPSAPPAPLSFDDLLVELAKHLMVLPPKPRADAVARVVSAALLFGLQPPESPRDGLVTTAQAAERCQVHAWTIREAIRRGELPHTRIGRCLRIRVADLDSFVAARREGGWRA
jgi:excisionase family DNA binding protein